MGIAEDLVIITIAALVCGILAQILRLPVMMGYIVAGVLLGPSTFGPTLHNYQDVGTLADIGIALLMFTVGLEFPIERLSSVRKLAIFGTPLQMVLCVFFGLLIGQVFGWDTTSSIWFGCLISVSSTMVVLKVLGNKGLMGTLSSRGMTAILIVQDLLVIPMMIILPSMKELSNHMGDMVTSLGLSLLWVGILALLGMRWMPRFITRVAASRNQELFMVTVLAVGLGAGYITYLNGLSFAFGAFIAGLILNRSDFSHQVMSAIIPLRDMFSLIFFASVGTMIELPFIINNWYIILTMLVIVLLGKSLIFGVTTRMFGYVNIMPLAVGLYMFPIGEFAFVLARLGKSSHSINDNMYMLIVSLAVISMTLTPFISEVVNPIYKLYRKYFPSTRVKKLAPVNTPCTLNSHIVVIGYGRVGRSICTAIRSRNTNIVIIEQHPTRVDMAKKDGFQVIGGDAASDTILQAANTANAMYVMMTIPDRAKANYITRKIHRSYPDIRICARAVSLEHLKEMLFYGASEVVVPECEASLSMIRGAMYLSDYPSEAADAVVRYLRSQRYEPLLEAHEELIVNENNEVQVLNRKTNKTITVYTKVSYDAISSVVNSQHGGTFDSAPTPKNSTETSAPANKTSDSPEEPTLHNSDNEGPASSQKNAADK